MTPVQPFLRWAGGKRWLVGQLPQLLGSFEFNAYHEPFLGGASVFLGLPLTGKPLTGKAYLSDLNSELIQTYERVRDDVEGVADALESHVNTEEHYYAVRQCSPVDLTERAARFIFLNYASFNGIYRVNLKGVYNVPFGRREHIKPPLREQLRVVSAKLQGVELKADDFEGCLANVTTGDLVFLDPPYTVAHNHNGFVKYNQRLFSFEDQQRLSRLIDEIRSRQAYYILTNAAHSSIASLFEKGDSRIETSRKNIVGGKYAVRGYADEYLFTNLAQI